MRGFLFAWNIHHVKEAVVSQDVTHYWSDDIFYPDGISLIAHTLSPLYGWIALIFPSLGIVTQFNLLWLSTFVLTGYATTLLSYALVRRLGPSIIAGIIFTFSTYRMVHALAHLNLISTHWLVFSILFFHKPGKRILM